VRSKESSGSSSKGGRLRPTRAALPSRGAPRPQRVGLWEGLQQHAAPQLQALAPHQLAVAQVQVAQVQTVAQVGARRAGIKGNAGSSGTSSHTTRQHV